MESRVDGVALIPSGKAALLLEELEEGLGIVAVDLHLLEARELRAVGQLAEVVDALVRTRGLLAKLVSGEVKDLEALLMVLLVELLQLLILRSETTARGRIDDKQDLVGILLEANHLALSVLYREIIYSSHFDSL